MFKRTCLIVAAAAALLTGCDPEARLMERMDSAIYTRDEMLNPPVCSRIMNPLTQIATEIPVPCESIRGPVTVIVRPYTLR